MNYLHTNTTDPYAFPLWPEAAASKEELMAWAQATGCAQPGPSMENIYLDDLLDTTALASALSGMTPAESFSFQTDSGTNWTSGGTVATDILSDGLLPDATAMATSTLAPAIMPPFPTDNTDAFIQGFFFTQPFVFTRSKALTDVSSLPSPQSDGTGGGFLPFPTFEATSSYLAQPPGLPFPQLNTAGTMGPNQMIGAPPTWSMGGSNFAGPVQTDSGPTPDPVMANSASLDYTQLIDNLTRPAQALTSPAMREIVPSSLGKRSRQSISKAAGCGAERPASTTARGLYHRSLLGLSVSQGSVGALEQEQPSWIEEREQMEARYDVGSSVPLQSVENAKDGEKLYKIPGKLTERERLMLQTTQADEERGAVRDIKCRVCPEREFGGWVTFRRHCNSCEKHPSALKFCSKCGDYFGRPDSKNRHKGKKYQGACLSTSQDEAKQKEQKVERLLKAFEARLKHCLRTGEDIRPLFSDVVTKKLTNTSKKVSKREETWVEGNSWADGL
ncbi:hypothetical protein EDB85DRAFT_2177855 [Lactarius pseudohatsudake]|nr:hypothetical protein EDB85DRAFT_2177855 [Lactarius pseudohatsudake]